MATNVIKFYWDKTSLLPYEPDILASQRYFKSYRRVTPAEPEKVLLFAVLAEAVETFQRFAFSEAPHKRRLFLEAKAWFWERRSSYPFSFRSICEVFGLDPGYLRRGSGNGLRIHHVKNLGAREFSFGREEAGLKQASGLPEKSSPRPLIENALM